jgi:hypothetical protein
MLFGLLRPRPLEVYMSEEDLEVLITLDDPGEEDLEEDTFHQVKDEVSERDPTHIK